MSRKNRRKKVYFSEAVKSKPWVGVLIPSQQESGRVATTNTHMTKKDYGKPAIHTAKGTATTFPASGKSSASE